MTRNIFNGGAWTQARFNSFIKSMLRAGSRRWEPKYTCLKDAYVDKRINNSTGRIAMHYSCAGCLSAFPLKDVQVDHIIPIIDPNVGFTTWDDVINKLFCEADNLQVLCIECHNKKTALEKAQSKERKLNDKSK